MENRQKPYLTRSLIPQNLAQYSIITLIINQELIVETYNSIIQHTTFLIAVDGGANQLFEKKLQDPNIIIGDLDSIRPEVLEYYNKNHVMVIKDQDQNTNDLQKALNYVILNVNHTKSHTKLLILGSLGRRFDQSLCNLSAIASICERNPLLQIECLDKYNFTCAITPFYDWKYILSEFEHPDGLGIVRFGKEKAKVVTKGLQWDLDETMELMFPEFLSSSNKVLEKEFTIQTDKVIFVFVQKKN